MTNPAPSPRHSRHQIAARLAELDELEITIEKLVEGGDGFGRFEGIPFFVPRSAPGDRLRVRLSERRPGYGRAEIVEVIEPAAVRRQPPCPHFDRCGGCDLQHLGEDAQLRYKAEAVRETLRRIGGIEMPAKVTVLPGRPWGYRLRTQLHLGEGLRGTDVGYFARGSHDLVPIERCPVLVPELEAALPDLPHSLGDISHKRIDLTAGDGSRWTVSPPVEGLPKGEVEARIGSYTYSYDARCFFQGHRQLASQLIEQALGEAPEAAAADAAAEETAFDLFAGVGLFSLPLAERYHKVVAVESDRVACRFLRKNARRNRLDNVAVEHRSVETWIAKLPEKPARVVVDPPRLGLPHALRRALVKRRPRQLTYVSCNAATLARDLKQLGSGFRLDSLALLDMFPQTGHMELVVQL
ncbi:MAG: class I SAM-dependent RNA methyltransferase, partial [Acidobacteriota bacterium]